jgi:hypothetical protein
MAKDPKTNEQILVPLLKNLEEHIEGVRVSINVFAQFRSEAYDDPEVLKDISSKSVLIQHELVEKFEELRDLIKSLLR